MITTIQERGFTFRWKQDCEIDVLDQSGSMVDSIQMDEPTYESLVERATKYLNEAEAAEPCDGCIHKYWVEAASMMTSSGWGCLLSGGHAVEICSAYHKSVVAVPERGDHQRVEIPPLQGFKKGRT